MSDIGTDVLGARARERRMIVLLVAGLVYAAWVATEVVAWRLSFHPNLGRPAVVLGTTGTRWARVLAGLLAAGCVMGVVLPRGRRAVPWLALLGIGSWSVSLGTVYWPTRLLVWGLGYQHVATIAPILRDAAYVFAGVAGVAAVAIILAVSRRSAAPVSGSHGTAQWGRNDELTVDAGVLVGVGESADRRRPAPLLRYDGDGHLLTVAPTRSGKGIGVVIPNLLSYPGSIVVTDPKGENHAVTVAARTAMGQTVHVLDPFGAVSGTASFNPLAIIDPQSADGHDDAWMLADMLVAPDGRAGDHVFWSEEARALLAGLILYVATHENDPRMRTLAGVRAALTQPKAGFTLMLAEMGKCEGLVARAAARLDQKDERERSGVISSAQSHTHFLDSKRMAAVMGSSTFAWEALKAGRATVYLVLPPERLRTYRRWMRLMVGCAMRAMTRVAGRPDVRVLFLLDEFAHLGRVAPIEDAVSLVGGYGVGLWMLVQDLAQLRKCYPDGWQTFLANADVLQTFGVNDWDTAEMMSKLTGEETIRVVSESRSSGVTRGRTGASQEGSGATTAERGRRLMLPDEIRRMAADDSLLLMRGRPPYRVRRIDYRSRPELAARAAANPMYEKVGA